MTTLSLVCLCIFVVSRVLVLSHICPRVLFVFTDIRIYIYICICIRIRIHLRVFLPRASRSDGLVRELCENRLHKIKLLQRVRRFMARKNRRHNLSGRHLEQRYSAELSTSKDLLPSSRVSKDQPSALERSA